MKTLARLAATGCVAGSLLVGGLVVAQTPQPEPEGSGLRFNGFGTIGLAHTSGPEGWGFRRDIGQPVNDRSTRADIDSRLGLQLNYSVSPQLEFVGQVLLKRRVDLSPPIDSLEWAFASYRPTPDWTIRVGRTNPDAFLLSDYRNVGFAYPWARPEIGFYGALPMYSIDGADVTRTWQVGTARWKAKLYSGSGAAYGAAGQGVAIKTIVHNISGLTLTREAEGLTLRAAISHARTVPGHTQQMQQLSDGLDALQALPIPAIAAQAKSLQDGLALQTRELTFYELGVSYEGSAWLWSAELSNISGTFASTAGYASLGRRFGPVTVYGVLAASRSSGSDQSMPDWAATAAPLLGPAAAQQLQALGSGAAFAINAQRQKQSSVSLGLRWDFHPQMALKVQWDRYRIDANGALLWANTTQDAVNVDVGSVLLDFIF